MDLMRNLCALVLTVSAVDVTARHAAADQIADVADLPMNLWVKLPGTFPNGYTYSGMIYAPDRGHVLHWGAVAHARGIQGCNDVRAFDPAGLKWVSDYPSDPEQSWGIVGGGSGRALSYCGRGRMLATGRPQAAMIVNAVTYDTRRRRIVYAMPALIAAYDPATATWRDLKAKTELHGRTLPGGPPVYGAGMCYDPVNDEIVMFPHFGAQSADMRPITGRIQGHLGTVRYSYKTNAWRRVGAELGTPELREARNTVISLQRKLSRAADDAYTRQGGRRGDAEGLKGLHDAARWFKAMDEGLDVTSPLKAARPLLEHARNSVGAAVGAERKRAVNWKAVLSATGRALWQLDRVLTEHLAVEPPARSVAPMVYDEKNQVIVLFGGDSGRIRADLNDRIEDRGKLRAARAAYDLGLNDTWVYDCKTRRWREISTADRPPARRAPSLHYDPHSGLVLLVTIEGDTYNTRIPRTITVWSLDASVGEWTKRAEQPWDGPIDRRGWYATGLDPKHRLLLVSHTQGTEQTTWVMRYDVNAMPSAPAPVWKAPPPETPTVVPPDDPTWVAKLKTLPANTWVMAKPPREAARRDWGSIACDPVNGWMVYFGGGHSTYQGTDVAIYAVGANRWVHQAGGYNDSLPPVGWGGYHMGVRGSNNAGHMRNQYVAIDGHMYMNIGFGSQLKPRGGDFPALTTAEIVSLPDRPHAWFYDINRGGVWRQLPTQIDGTLPRPSRGSRGGRPSVVDLKGLVYGLDIIAERRYSNQPKAARVAIYDIYQRTTTIKPIPAPWPKVPPESRPYCMVTDRNVIFFQDFDPKTRTFRTWSYDVLANRFRDLNPANQPTAGRATGAAYIAGQDAVLAIINPTHRQYEQWVYLFERNEWIQLPLRADGKMGFQAPYTQMDYVAKYGVLVNYAGRTWVMRPECSRLNRE